MHPFRVLMDSELRLEGVAVIAREIRLTPDQVERTATTSRGPLTERWSTALDVPAMFWSVEAPETAELTMTWRTDLRRMWPYPAGACGDLCLTVDSDGRRVMVQAVGDPFRVVFVTDCGAFESLALDGPAVGFTLRATGHCRLIALAGADEADWDRTVQMLDDAASRDDDAAGQHARQLAAYATGSPRRSLTSMRRSVGQGRMDECLAGTPGIGRSWSRAAGHPPRAAPTAAGSAWYFGRDACRTAMAQLAAGDRDGLAMC
jgi:hypothetical protein